MTKLLNHSVVCEPETFEGLTSDTVPPWSVPAFFYPKAYMSGT